MARLLEVGYTVLVPYGDSSRYDLVIEDGDGRFWRVQCKTAYMEKDRHDEGHLQFATASLRSRQGNGHISYSRQKYQGEVDYFAVYSHELKKVYLVPAEHVADRTRMNLRQAPSKNNQKRGVHFAADYEV